MTSRPRARALALLVVLASACAIDFTVSTSASSGDTACGPALLACDDACVDPASDAAHCGECGKVCDGDELCIDARCRRASVAACDLCPCNECDGAACCAELIEGAIVCVEDDGCG